MQCRRKVSLLLALTVVWVWCLASHAESTPIMVEKNLFAQDRKPPSPESVAQNPQPNKPGLSAKALQLDGVFIRGDVRKAIVRVKGQLPGADKAKAQNPYLTVAEGEKIGDFQVVKIEPRRISLEKDGQTEVVNLFAEGKVVVPVPPQPTSPSPAPPPPQPGQVPPGQMGAQPPQPPMPPGQMGGGLPGVGYPPTVANPPPGGHRVAPPPAGNQPDMGLAPDDGGDTDEETSEEPST
jgi:hypothetical protein